MNRTIGATFIVAGTTIGAGMLAMPLSAAPLGFLGSSLGLFTLWLLMYLSATSMVKCSLLTSPGQSIAWIVGEVFGDFPKHILTFVLIIFLNALLAAYFEGGSSILQSYFPDVNPVVLKTGFLLAFGFPAVIGTYWIDHNNRLLFGIMMILFFIMISFLVPHVSLQNLATYNISQPSIWAIVLPVFFTSFGFHASIPSLIQYCGKDETQLKFVMFWGSLIPCVLYFIWLLVTQGVLPIEGALSFSTLNTGDIGGFSNLLGQVTSSPSIHIFSTLFAFLAIATSFLGVSVGLFDLIDERVNLSRVPVSILTFAPSFLWSLFSQYGFVEILKYAAIFLSLLAVVSPAMVLFKMKQGNQILNVLMILFGIIIMILGY